MRRLVEALRAHEHVVAAGLCGLLVLVYLWPVLVGGDVLSASSMLYQWVPWRGVAPPDLREHINLLLTDPPMSYEAWNALGRELIQSGTFPAWNEHAFAGTPLFANLSLAWLSPFSLPLWVLPQDQGAGVAAALKLWVAAFGVYLLVRELRLGFWPGLLAAASFALCAFNVVWLSHGAHVSVAVLLPWAIWLTERIARRGGRVEPIALALVVAAALAGGHPGTQVHILAGTLLYAGVRLALVRELAWQGRLQRFATVGGAMLVGALLVAVVLIPGERATVDTIGSEVRRDGGSSTLIGSTMPLETLKTALFPDWWARASEGVTEGPANYNERAFYAGGMALLFALVALVSAGGWRRKAAFLPLAALGLAVPLGVSPIRELVVGLPAFDRVQNQRLLLWFAFAVAVLAAFGLEATLRAPRRQLRAWAVVAVAAVGGLLALRTVELAPGDVGGAFDHLLDRFAGLTSGALALSSVARWLLLVAVAAIALLLVRRRPQLAWLAGALVVAVAAIEMLQFAHGYQPMGPAATTIPPRTPAVAYLQEHRADGRIAGLNFALTSDWSTRYGLRDVRGYDAPQPSRRFAQLWTALNPQQEPWRPFDIPTLTVEGLTVLGTLGGRYIVTEPGSARPALEQPGLLAYAYRGDDATVFENKLAAPRARVAEQVAVAASEEEEIVAVTLPGFDPRSEAVVRADEVGAAAPTGSSGTVRVVAEENARVTLEATLGRPGLVVLADAWAPGWSVAVDGEPARALQANVVTRGVVVPAGTHEIVWSYRVPGLRLGAALSAVTLLGLLAWGTWLLVRSRRSAR